MQDRNAATIPVSVNYFLSRLCNYRCSYCFHTNTTSDMLDLPDIRRGLTMLRDTGMRKLNISGGEPFIHATTRLGPIVSFCKADLGLESISIVSNGSLVTHEWLKKYGQYIDILAISCDSFIPGRNATLGRGDGEVVDRLDQVANWCREFGIKMKLNTVVCLSNWQEDMNAGVTKLDPFRWKCFQMLIVKGENAGGLANSCDARSLAITDEQFEHFVGRHREQAALIAESNRVMRNSYLLLDEQMRFLNCQNGGKEPTQSILSVGVAAALKNSGFCASAFEERGGVYDWSREQA